jgi:hypothetical protein|tara:strand:+ start:1102 stop:1287 length:186 start_codon:yes stop_codon:yes gene_type:complete
MKDKTILIINQADSLQAVTFKPKCIHQTNYFIENISRFYSYSKNTLDITVKVILLDWLACD